MKDIKLLALDIDGTILTREMKLADRTRTAIEAASDFGMVVALVTGRPFYGINGCKYSALPCRIGMTKSVLLGTGFTRLRRTVQFRLFD